MGYKKKWRERWRGAHLLWTMSSTQLKGTKDTTREKSAFFLNNPSTHSTEGREKTWSWITNSRLALLHFRLRRGCSFVEGIGWELTSLLIFRASFLSITPGPPQNSPLWLARGGLPLSQACPPLFLRSEDDKDITEPSEPVNSTLWSLIGGKNCQLSTKVAINRDAVCSSLWKPSASVENNNSPCA